MRDFFEYVASVFNKANADTWDIIKDKTPAKLLVIFSTALAGLMYLGNNTDQTIEASIVGIIAGIISIFIIWFYRLISSPYLLWKEERDKRRIIQNEQLKIFNEKTGIMEIITIRTQDAIKFLSASTPVEVSEGYHQWIDTISTKKIPVQPFMDKDKTGRCLSYLNDYNLFLDDIAANKSRYFMNFQSTIENYIAKIQKLKQAIDDIG